MQILIILLEVIIFIAILIWLSNSHRKKLTVKRKNIINKFVFPLSIHKKIIDKYPHLSDQDVNHVMAGLREYFHLCSAAKGSMVAMPSQVVDIAWHEFLLFTREYEVFCKAVFGRFLHHVPTENMPSTTTPQAGIETAWKLACARENMALEFPHKLPLIFEIDRNLKISDGFHYTLNCESPRGFDYCMGNVSCSANCLKINKRDRDLIKLGRDLGEDLGQSLGGGCSGGCSGGD